MYASIYWWYQQIFHYNYNAKKTNTTYTNRLVHLYI